MLSGDALRQALADLPIQPQQGTAYRVIPAQYHLTALSGIGALKHGGRYNPKEQLEALYLSENLVVALQEVNALKQTDRGLVGLATNPKTLLSVHYTLQRVLDLTNHGVQRQLHTTMEELIQPWLLAQSRGEVPPTQQLGVAATAQGIEALIAPSAVNPSASNLVFYPVNLQLGSTLHIEDDSGFISAALP